MSLFNCSECHGIVSDKAYQCPHCGTKEYLKVKEQHFVEERRPADRMQKVIITLSVMVIVIAVMVIYVEISNYREQNYPKTQVSISQDVKQVNVLYDKTEDRSFVGGKRITVYMKNNLPYDINNIKATVVISYKDKPNVEIDIAYNGLVKSKEEFSIEYNVNDIQLNQAVKMIVETKSFERLK